MFLLLLPIYVHVLLSCEWKMSLFWGDTLYGKCSLKTINLIIVFLKNGKAISSREWSYFFQLAILYLLCIYAYYSPCICFRDSIFYALASDFLYSPIMIHGTCCAICWLIDDWWDLIIDDMIQSMTLIRMKSEVFSRAGLDSVETLYPCIIPAWKSLLPSKLHDTIFTLAPWHT